MICASWRYLRCKHFSVLVLLLRPLIVSSQIGFACACSQRMWAVCFTTTACTTWWYDNVSTFLSVAQFVHQLDELAAFVLKLWCQLKNLVTLANSVLTTAISTCHLNRVPGLTWIPWSLTGKLAPHFCGPFRTLQPFGATCYSIESVNRWRIRKDWKLFASAHLKDSMIGMSAEIQGTSIEFRFSFSLHHKLLNLAPCTWISNFAICDAMQTLIQNLNLQDRVFRL